MSLSLSQIKQELEAGIAKAVTVTDLADHFAQMVQKYSALVPGSTQDINEVVSLINDVDTLLHTLQGALA